MLGTGEGSSPQSSNAPGYAKRPDVADRGAFLIVVVGYNTCLESVTFSAH